MNDFFLTFVNYYLLKDNFSKLYALDNLHLLTPNYEFNEVDLYEDFENKKLRDGTYLALINKMFRDRNIFNDSTLEDFINIMVKFKICDKDILTTNDFFSALHNTTINHLRNLPEGGYDIFLNSESKDKRIDNDKDYKEQYYNALTFFGGFMKIEEEINLLNSKNGQNHFIDFFILNNCITDEEKNLILDKHREKLKNLIKDNKNINSFEYDPSMFMLNKRNRRANPVVGSVNFYLNNKNNCLPKPNRENTFDPFIISFIPKYVKLEHTNIFKLNMFFPNIIEPIKKKMKLTPYEKGNSYKFDNPRLVNSVLKRKFKDYGLDYTSLQQSSEQNNGMEIN